MRHGSYSRRANEGELLFPPEVVGRRLWDFIEDLETRHIYQLLHERVRTRGGPVRLSLRCDAPEHRRLLELSISPASDQGLTYCVSAGEPGRPRTRWHYWIPIGPAPRAS